jgi:hypothetical protein
MLARWVTIVLLVVGVVVVCWLVFAFATTEPIPFD